MFIAYQKEKSFLRTDNGSGVGIYRKLASGYFTYLLLIYTLFPASWVRALTDMFLMLEDRSHVSADSYITYCMYCDLVLTK